MPSHFAVHTIAFAPSKGPSLLHQFFWEQLPQIAFQNKEKELQIHIAPGNAFKQWHKTVKKPKLFVEMQLEKLIERQHEWGFIVTKKEFDRTGELVIVLPTKHAEEILNAHNIFFHTFLPYTRIMTKNMEVDFSHVKNNHIKIIGSSVLLKKVFKFIRTPLSRGKK